MEGFLDSEPRQAIELKTLALILLVLEKKIMVIFLIVMEIKYVMVDIHS